MDYDQRLLLYLVRVGLNPATEPAPFEFSEIPDWKRIIKESTSHGVISIAFDGFNSLINRNIIPEQCMPERKIKVSWALNVYRQENIFKRQFTIAAQVADEFAKHGVRTAVLKGTAIALLYPEPTHRPCGDFDCFLLGDYEKGNVIAEQMGAEVSRYYYKHSHIIYKKLTIENHQFCTLIRGRKQNKVFERKLQDLLCKEELQSIRKTNLLAPTPMFNALFLTAHAWGHFLLEGIKLRHVTDWSVFLEKCVDQIDWQEFKNIITARDKKMFLFAESFSIIAHKYFGSPLPDVFDYSKDADTRSEKVIASMFEKQNNHYGQCYGYWKGRYMMIKNSIAANWKYKEFSEYGVLSNSLNNIVSFIVERHPHL